MRILLFADVEMRRKFQCFEVDETINHTVFVENLYSIEFLNKF
jgi:hypothetical protein